jgi:hypothetical protein
MKANPFGIASEAYFQPAGKALEVDLIDLAE